MQDTIPCQRCKSERVMADIVLGTTTVTIGRSPGSAGIRGHKSLQARICADCGHVDLATRPEDRDDLWDRYVKLRLDGDPGQAGL